MLPAGIVQKVFLKVLGVVLYHSKKLAKTIMNESEFLILRTNDVLSALVDQDERVMELVSQAYLLHALGDTSLPHSAFLYLPGNEGKRIIALPAYLGGEIRSAGIKWVASVPANITRGLDRASAVVILNSIETGLPKAALEGSVISARRTAASAILAAKLMRAGELPDTLSVIGCGYINYEVVRLAARVFPALRKLYLFDLEVERAEFFRKRVVESSPNLVANITESVQEAAAASLLVSIATTASSHHIDRPEYFLAGSTILHISLRDLSPDFILASDNVVDDPDHVCRFNTSMHLTEELTGGRQFIRCSIGDILLGQAIPRDPGRRCAVFSPFGLGILDLSLAEFVYQQAVHRGLGIAINEFCAKSWHQ
jgi:ornithine cyclodeaminase